MEDGAGEEAFLRECGVCLVRNRRMLRLPCAGAHLLCQLCLQTVQTRCPFCRSSIEASEAVVVLFGGVHCRICGDSKSAEDTVLCWQCQALLCLGCFLKRHDRNHDFIELQDSSLLRSVCATLEAGSESSSESLAAFLRKGEAALRLLWAGEPRSPADALREALEGAAGPGAGRPDHPLRQATAQELARQFLGLARVAEPAAEAASVRELFAAESPESLAELIRSGLWLVTDRAAAGPSERPPKGQAELQPQPREKPEQAAPEVHAGSVEESAARTEPEASSAPAAAPRPPPAPAGRSVAGDGVASFVGGLLDALQSPHQRNAAGGTDRREQQASSSGAHSTGESKKSRKPKKKSLPTASSPASGSALAATPVPLPPPETPDHAGTILPQHPLSFHQKAAATFQRHLVGWLSKKGRAFVRGSTYESLLAELGKSQPRDFGRWTYPSVRSGEFWWPAGDGALELERAAAALLHVKDCTLLSRPSKAPFLRPDQTGAVASGDVYAEEALYLFGGRLPSSSAAKLLSAHGCRRTEGLRALEAMGALSAALLTNRDGERLLVVLGRETMDVWLVHVAPDGRGFHSFEPLSYRWTGPESEGLARQLDALVCHGEASEWCGLLAVPGPEGEPGLLCFDDGSSSATQSSVNFLYGSLSKPASGWNSQSVRLQYRKRFSSKWLAYQTLLNSALLYFPDENKVYMIGGMTREGVAQERVLRFSAALPPRLGWDWAPEVEEVAPLPVALSHAAAAVHRGRVVVTGGVDDQRRVSSSTFILHGNRWLKGPDMREARHEHVLVVMGGRLLAAGGAGDAVDALRSVEELEEAEGQAGRWRLWEESFASPVVAAASFLLPTSLLPRQAPAP